MAAMPANPLGSLHVTFGAKESAQCADDQRDHDRGSATAIDSRTNRDRDLRLREGQHVADCGAGNEASSDHRGHYRHHAPERASLDCTVATALDLTRGRRIEAAQRLGIGRNTITRKIQELGLDD